MTDNERMAVESRSAERGPMVIRVAIEKVDPLTGHAVTEQGQERGFHGWLGLLNAFSELLDPGVLARGRQENPGPDAGAGDGPRP